MNFYKRPPRILFFILALAFIFRVIVSPFGTLRLDMNAWMGWADRLATLPLDHFYDYWSDYLPGYLYVLFILGKVAKLIGTSDVLFKLPSVAADVVTGWFIYLSVERLIRESFHKTKNFTDFKKKAPLGRKIALVAAAVYLFNPAVWANSAVWGQVDGFSSLVVMASLYFVITGRYLLSVFVLGPGVLIKPQVGLLWLLVAMVLISKNKVRALSAGSFGVVVFVALSFWPFAGTKPLLSFILDRLAASFNQYPYTSLNAFNVWGIGGGGGWWIKDLGPAIFGVNYQVFGATIFALLLLVVLFVVKRSAERNPSVLFLAASVTQLAAFFFMTRVHERHLLPVMAPLIVFAAISADFLGVLLVLAVLSLTYVTNLAFSYYWISEDFRRIIDPLWVSFFSLVNGFGLLFLMKILIEQIKRPVVNLAGGLAKLLTAGKGSRPERGWLITLAVGTLRKLGNFMPGKGDDLSTLPEVPFIRRNWKWWLIGIMVFALFTRLLRLGTPDTYMFDEVYHAFTAREMLKGNKAAWEWWNTPPQGFAYEWSHPPLAKELMMTTLSLVNSSLGWRIPGALLGTLSVILVFTIAWEVFRNRSIAILSAALFSLDTLPLVMSRIGMNDAYFLFFLLLAVWMLLRRNYLLMGVTWGLSVASKWTAIYFLGFVLFVWLVSGLWRSTRSTLLLAVSCLLIAPTVYLFSYLPFFTWGHTPSQFNELQHQMWWYHTGLKATHPYQSQWWSWPLTLRPVWIAVDYQRDTIANVYAQGNPILYWVGVVAIVVALVIAVRDRQRVLGITIAGYGMFFFPWAFSPRIMFIYHYLPSTPFLAMLVAWFLIWLWQRGKRKLASSLFFFIVLAFVFFYPHVTSFVVPNEIDKFFYWLRLWK